MTHLITHIKSTNKIMFLVTLPTWKCLVKEPDAAKALVPEWDFNKTGLEAWTNHKGVWVEPLPVKKLDHG